MKARERIHRQLLDLEEENRLGVRFVMCEPGLRIGGLFFSLFVLRLRCRAWIGFADGLAIQCLSIFRVDL